MTTRKVLFITEGEKTEVDALKKLLRAVSQKDYEFYEYGKGLASLMKMIFDDDDDIDDAMEIQLLLAENEPDIQKKRRLQEYYSDIFMIFDLDPQRGYTSKELGNISKLIRHFSNSSDVGKIYINYPMMESYLHLNSPDDESFRTRKIKISDCRRYKQIVNEYSYLKDPSNIRKDDFIKIVKIHLRKANSIIGNGFVIPDRNDFFLWDENDIFTIQRGIMDEEGAMWVLNTSLFSVVSYNSEFFLND